VKQFLDTPEAILYQDEEAPLPIEETLPVKLTDIQNDEESAPQGEPAAEIPIEAAPDQIPEGSAQVEVLME
jgi:hypothetical protein